MLITDVLHQTVLSKLYPKYLTKISVVTNISLGNSMLQQFQQETSKKKQSDRQNNSYNFLLTHAFYSFQDQIS